MDKLTRLSAEILGVLEEHELSSSRLTSTQVGKRIRRSHRPDTEQMKIQGYALTQNLFLTLDKLDLYAGVVDRLLRLDGVNNIRSSL